MLIKSTILLSAVRWSAIAKGTTRQLAGGAPGCTEGVGCDGLAETRQSHRFIRQLHSSATHPFPPVCFSEIGVLSVVDDSRRVRRIQDSTLCTNIARAYDQYRRGGVHVERSGLPVSRPIFFPVPVRWDG